MSYPQQEQQTPTPEQRSFLSSGSYSRGNAFQLYAQDSSIQFVRPRKWTRGRLRITVVALSSGDVTVEAIQAGSTWSTVLTLSFTVATPAEEIVLDGSAWLLTADDLALKVTGTGTEAILIEYVPENRQ